MKLPSQTADEASSVAWFDARAERFDAGYARGAEGGHRLRARLAAAVRLIGSGPGAVLDAGMGPGRLAAALDEAGWTVHGIDGSPRMVDLARARVPAAAGRFQVARLEQLPYPDGAFDSALCVGVLEYTEIERSLAELVRVVRPGGRLVVGFRRAAAPCRLWRDEVVRPAARLACQLAGQPERAPARRRRPLSTRAVRRLLAAYGLEVEAVEVVASSILPDPLDALLPGLAARLAELADRSPRARRLLGLHLLVAARKPAAEPRAGSGS